MASNPGRLPGGYGASVASAGPGGARHKPAAKSDTSARSARGRHESWRSPLRWHGDTRTPSTTATSLSATGVDLVEARTPLPPWRPATAPGKPDALSRGSPGELRRRAGRRPLAPGAPAPQPRPMRLVSRPRDRAAPTGPSPTTETGNPATRRREDLRDPRRRVRRRTITSRATPRPRPTRPAQRPRRRAALFRHPHPRGIEDPTSRRECGRPRRSRRAQTRGRDTPHPGAPKRVRQRRWCGACSTAPGNARLTRSGDSRGRGRCLWISSTAGRLRRRSSTCATSASYSRSTSSRAPLSTSTSGSGSSTSGGRGWQADRRTPTRSSGPQTLYQTGR